MIRLRVLGQIDLRGEDGNEIRPLLAQPKRLALLAYLAVAAGAPHRRDRLLGLFWPELDEDRARNALSKGIHFLRQALGTGSILTRTADEVAVDRAVVGSDVEAFRRAIDEDRLEDAIATYRGDLLPDFYIPQAQAFEEWLERERATLRTQAARAARLLADRLAEARKTTGALDQARLALELSDGDERVLRHVISLFHQLGDRAGALRAYEQFRARLEAEVGGKPSVETVALLEEIRRTVPSPVPTLAGAEPTPPPSPARALDRFAAAIDDRYQVEGTLGAGGMALVLLATDTKLQRRVAIKLLRPELSEPGLVQRFKGEVLIMATLNHPHLVPLLDSGEAEGFLYYVMPWHTGESLRDRLTREGSLPISEAIRIVRDVADGLTAAHARGIIHRDIKPENILIGSDHALLADFGIARTLEDRPGVTPIWTSGSSGTPAYVSPEQSRASKDLDPRSDVYSLGCVLYELLTGRTPFDGDTVAALVAHHQFTTPTAVRELRPDVPPALAALVERALSKNPHDRPGGAGEFRSALQTISAATAPAVPWRRLAVIGGAALIGGLGLASFILANRPPRVSLGQRTAIATSPSRETYPSLSPDGSTIVYSVDAYLMATVAERSVANPAVERRLLPAKRWGLGLPVHSPDGRQILLSSLFDGLAVMAADSGATPRLITPLGRSGAWSPDGERLVVVTDSTLAIYSTGIGEPRVLIRGAFLHSPAWSPDGAWIAYARGDNTFHFNGNVAASQLWLIGANDTVPHLLVDGGLNTSPVWLPGHRSLLFVSNMEGGRDIYQLDLRADGTPRDAPRRISTGLDAEHISLSRDGKKLAYSKYTEASNIWSLPRNPRSPLPISKANRVTTGARVIENFSISSDGEWLYFDSDQRGITHLFRKPLRGGPETQLSFDGSGDYAPRVSVDGNEIAFHAQRGPGPDRDVFVMPASGGIPVRVSTSPEEELAAHLSPDRTSLVWNQPGSTGSSLWISRRKLDGSWGPAMPLLNADSLGSNAAAWSPDGRWIAFHGAGGIQIFSPRTRELRTLLPFDSGPAQGPVWDPDSRSVVVDLTAPDGGFMIGRIWIDSRRRSLIGYSDDASSQEHRSGMTVFGDSVYFALTARLADIWVADLRID